jgi:hypothetical protein
MDVGRASARQIKTLARFRHVSCIMRRPGIALFLILISSAAFAQQPPAQPVFTVQTDDAASRRVDVELGEVLINTHNTRYHLVYLPVLPPLPGTAFRSVREIPNGLELTGTQIPKRPHHGAAVAVTIR